MPSAFQTMLLLCVIWGIQQVTIKWAATDIAPVMQAAIRSGIAATLVGLLMCWRGGWEGLRQGTLGAGLLTGTLFALEFLFIALGLQYTTASHMSVFLYTAPIFSALGLHFLLPSERLRPLQWLGVAVCFGGIAVPSAEACRGRKWMGGCCSATLSACSPGCPGARPRWQCAAPGCPRHRQA